MILSKGYADGILPSRPAAERAELLDLIRAEVGPDGFVRAPLTWVAGGEPNWSKYDTFLREVQQRRMRVIWQVNTTGPGGGDYVIPTTDQWGPVLAKLVEHYWPLGCYTWEIWNEWRTVTGNAAGRMTDQDMIRLLADAKHAIRAQIAGYANQTKLNLCALACGTFNFTGLDALYQLDPGFLTGYTTVTFHVYQNQDPTLPGGRDYVRRIRTLDTMRGWLADRKIQIDMGITEGGYSGSGDAAKPRNCVTLTEQADWTKASLDWVKSQNDRLRVRFWCPFHVRERGGTTYKGTDPYQYDYWEDHLGMYHPDSSPKPVAPTYAAWVG